MFTSSASLSSPPPPSRPLLLPPPDVAVSVALVEVFAALDTSIVARLRALERRWLADITEGSARVAVAFVGACAATVVWVCANVALALVAASTVGVVGALGVVAAVHLIVAFVSLQVLRSLREVAV